MSERLPEPTPPLTYSAPVEPSHEVARKNLVLGWALFGLVLLIFGATILVAYVYLALD